MSGAVDLFGDPVPEVRGRGRPAHVPTQATRDRVALLLAFGWSNSRIANALTISEPTLRKFYGRELKAREIMRDRLDARIAEKLMEGVNTGNVGAIKEFRKLVERNDQMTAAQHYLKPVDDEKRKEERLGKKEQRQVNAEKGSSQGVFAVPQAPRRSLQ